MTDEEKKVVNQLKADTNLEWASVRALREVQSLNYKLEKLKDKIKAKIEEVKDGTFDAKIVLQSLLEKE